MSVEITNKIIKLIIDYVPGDVLSDVMVALEELDISVRKDIVNYGRKNGYFK